ncbi:MAG TPA: sigma-70 family RNA polymerase sigma factor [Candidatus Dormibacteraeota bacterium]|nr:sigma-70 family RNA polymerase sigma factor [Candidatus Dormibacteraeota bacterium]
MHQLRLSTVGQGQEQERAEEQQLVERAKHDPEAFGALYDLHVQRIYRFVYFRVHDWAMAEDVTSEVFFRALQGIGRYRSMGRPFSAWLYQIAVNVLAERFRAARRVEDLERFHTLSDGVSPEELANQREEVRRIWSLVDALPQQQRMAIILKFRDGLTTEEIGVVMRKSMGAVRVLIHRGMAALKRQIAHNEIGVMGA